MLIRSALGAADKRRIQAMLFANNGGDLRQQLLDGSLVFLPLTHTAIPTRGDITPTFTRATTATFQDHEGVQRTAVAGEARFTGARRVRNLLPSTEGAFDAGSGWTLLNGAITTGVEDPNGGSTAYTLTQSGAPSCELYPTTPFVNSSTRSSLWIRRRTGTGTISLYGGDSATNITSQVTSEWNRVTSNASASAAVGFDLRLFDSGDAIDFWHPQAEDITGRTDQTTPSEYVSVGVLSAPYHGAGVDGVEFFNTDRDGAVIPAATNTGYLAEGARTNLCLQSNSFTTTWLTLGSPTITQNVVGPDGATSAWTLTDATAADFSRIYQNITLTAATHTLSLFVKKAASVVTNCPLMLIAQGANIAAVTMDNYNGVATVWTSYGGLATVTSSARCSSYNDDYWRFELTFLATAAAWTCFLYPCATSSATQASGVEAAAPQGSAVFYGAQVELGSSASTYIATTTAAVTRAADVDAYPTASNILAAAGTVYLEFTPDHTPSGTIALWGTYVDASNYTAILRDATNMIMRKRIAGVNYDATIANAFSANTTYKVCGSWGASGVTVTVNGTEGTPHANTTAAQIAATMQWGADGNSLQQPFATERNARVWQRQLSASERGAITS